jgi:hypothetical protein
VYPPPRRPADATPQQHRLDRHVEGVAHPRRSRNLADAAAHRLGQVTIRRRELADAAHPEAVGPHPGAKGAVGEDRELGGGVEPVEIGGRVRFGEAARLRVGHRFLEREFLLEARHHEVARAVHDAGKTQHLVGAMRQVTDDRQGRRRRGLAVERRGRAFGEHAQIRELRGEQRLVGRDHGFAGGERGREDRLDGRAASHFHHDVHVGIAHEFERVGRLRDAIGEGCSHSRQVPHGETRDAEAHAVAVCHRALLPVDHLEQAAAHRAAAHHADAQLAHGLDAHAVETWPRRRGHRPAEGAGAAQQVREFL